MIVVIIIINSSTLKALRSPAAERSGVAWFMLAFLKLT